MDASEETRTLAIIDLGSNSFHMMISRVEGQRVTVLDRVREPVRLRLGLGEDGSLSEEAQARALACLSRFAQRLRGIDQIRVVGTNTLRRTKNPTPFLRKIEALLKTPVDVIGGREEARLIYLGVASSLPPSDLRNFVVDIGGGSTEFIIGRGMEHMARETRPMGCVAFTMDHFPDGVPTKKRLAKAVLSVAQELEGFQQLFHRSQWDRCIGSSGTIKAIGAVLQGLGQGTQITPAGLEQILAKLKWNVPLTKNSLPGLREDRVPVFLGGLAVLKGVFDFFGIERMEISANSMREGLLLDALGRDQHTDPRQTTVNHLMRFYNVDRDQAYRVRQTALALFPQVMGEYFKRREEMRLLLCWAAELHEMGMAVAHSGYHKHGAYIIQNGDLEGFSQVEQSRLAFLVLNHRKRLKAEALPFGAEPEWPLVMILRLAYLLNREHVEFTLPDIAINLHKKTIELFIDRTWLQARPMTCLDLEQEQRYWRRIDYTLAVNGATVP